jgi:hypothetical protein
MDRFASCQQMTMAHALTCPAVGSKDRSLQPPQEHAEVLLNDVRTEAITAVVLGLCTADMLFFGCQGQADARTCEPQEW